MPDDERSDDESTDNSQSEPRPPGRRRLIALGKPPFDDPDPEAMDRFLEDMAAQIRASEAAEDADGTVEQRLWPRSSGETESAATKEHP